MGGLCFFIFMVLLNWYYCSYIFGEHLKNRFISFTAIVFGLGNFVGTVFTFELWALSSQKPICFVYTNESLLILYTLYFFLGAITKFLVTPLIGIITSLIYIFNLYEDVSSSPSLQQPRPTQVIRFTKRSIVIILSVLLIIVIIPFFTFFNYQPTLKSTSINVKITRIATTPENEGVLEYVEGLDLRALTGYSGGYIMNNETLNYFLEKMYSGEIINNSCYIDSHDFSWTVMANKSQYSYLSISNFKQNIRRSGIATVTRIYEFDVIDYLVW
ncbi:MAG: hypothetical protein ACFFBD_10055, partial [Candidatus Hodarchaeota archaeon]